MFNLVVLIIVIVGSLNWLAIGAFQFDVIAGIFGSQSVFIARFCYTLIGLAGIWFLLLVAIKKGQINLRKKNNVKNDSEIEKKDENSDAKEKCNEDSNNNQINKTKVDKEEINNKNKKINKNKPH